MNVFGTEMHIITFLITCIEAILFFVSLVHYFERPSDSPRLWILLLFTFVLFYNISGGLFPDPSLRISVQYQNLISYGAGALLGIYYSIYMYKAFKLTKLKFIAYYGAFLYIGLPYLILYVVPYLLGVDSAFLSRLVVIIPFVYGIALGYSIIISLRQKYFEKDSKSQGHYRWHIITVILTFLFFLSMPVIVFMDGPQWLEHLLTNTGFLVMAQFYVVNIIYNAKDEFQALRSSKEELKILNSQLHDRIDEKTQEMQNILDKKSNTLINLAHELKTPITLQQIYLDDLENQFGASEALDVLKYNTSKIAEDVRNFFDLEKIQKGKTVYSNDQVCNISKTLEMSIALFTKLAQAKTITLNSELEEDLYVKADPAAVYRIVNNLIDNALKYTPAGKKVKVSLQSKDHIVQLMILDQGIGIDESYMEQIFKPYFQLDTKKSNHQGMGMGLSIVKEILNSINADIEVKSVVNEGSVFTVSIQRFSPGKLHKNGVPKDLITKPYYRYDTSPASDEISIVGNKSNILLVEDNMDLLISLKNHFSSKFNVIVAANGADALEKLETSQMRIDIIISDIMMDNINGHELFQIVSKSPKYKHVPFLFMTAKTGLEERLSGLKHGVLDYIEKPFSINVLITKIENLLGLMHKQRQSLINDALLHWQSHDPTSIDSSTKEYYISKKAKQYQLSERELDVCHCIINGMTNKEIEEKLSIANNTVKKHISNIFKKLNVEDRSDLRKLLMQ